MFKKRLEELRNEKGLTKQQMADILGITRQAYGNYENGKREPDFKTTQKLADFFGVSVDYLLGRTNSKEVDILEALEDNNTRIKAGDKPLTPEQRVAILETLDEEKPKDKYKELYEHPLLADLLKRVPDLTDEEKESLADHLEYALKIFERERQRRRERGEL